MNDWYTFSLLVLVFCSYACQFWGEEYLLLCSYV